jgi:hypothetical protein
MTTPAAAPAAADTSRKEKYGMSFPKSWSSLDIELYCFRIGRTEEQKGLGKAGHFWKCVSYLYAPGNPVKNRSKYFIRNPWSEWMIDAACGHRYVAVGGCAGSTKSATYAMWLLINFLADSRNTLGIMLSTSLKAAKQRIWGILIEFVNAVPSLPLKVVESQGLIRYESPGFVSSNKASLTLIAAERKQEKEAVANLIGMHNTRVIVVADELSELTESILEYALPGGNLTSNPEYQFIGLSNPPGYFDPFAHLWKPKDGWMSINVDSDEWETNYGIGLHLDATKSPNILDDRAPYRSGGFMALNSPPFLPTKEKVAEAERDEGGANSIRFWRMVRGFPSPIGEEDQIYCSADIIKYKGDVPAVWGDTPVSRCAALDPGFTNGGDRSIAYFGTVGRTREGLIALNYDEFVELVEDVTNKKDERPYQIAKKFADECTKRRIQPQHVAVDATGAGEPFCSILATIWSPLFLRVKFGGRASDLPTSLTSGLTGKELYYDRVSELWYRGRELLRQGQLKGIPPAMQREMCARKFGTTGAEKKIYVESKVDMKLRTHFSPDIADAGFILLDLACNRMGLVVQLTREQRQNVSTQKLGSWRNVVFRRRAGHNMTEKNLRHL